MNKDIKKKKIKNLIGNEVYTFGEWLPLCFDNVFKSFFLSKETINYKSRLLSLITGIDEQEFINNATYVSEELPVKSINEKRNITDIIVRINNDAIISLEMNSEYYDLLVGKNNRYSHLKDEVL